jgi:lysophospholipase L1-like esterase
VIRRPLPRRPLLAVPAAAAAGAVTLGAEALYAVRRGLPSVTGHDPSGLVGDRSQPEVTILLLGDSTITGSGVESVDDIWIRRIAARLSDRWRFRLDSLARGGARVREVLVDQLPEALQRRADLVIVSAGANDVLRATPLDQVERDLTEIVAELATVAPSVLLTGVGDLGNVPRVPFPLRLLASSRSRAVDRIHARVANEFPYADKVRTGVMNGRFSRDVSLFSSDWFHPSRAGHEIWADAATPMVEAALERVTAQHRAHA